MKSTFREIVRVRMHLNGGFTRVLIESTEGLGMADGGTHRDIPTDLIPPHLRKMGSRFLLVDEAPFSGASGHTYETIHIKEIANA
jgi:hypothetical protein